MNDGFRQALGFAILAGGMDRRDDLQGLLHVVELMTAAGEQMDRPMVPVGLGGPP